MKNKQIKITISIVIFLILTLLIQYNILAIDTELEIGQTSSATSSEAIIGRTLGIFQTVGTVVAVIALIIIGMRYMFSSLEDRAQMKGVIWYYIFGAILVLCTSNVLVFAYDLITSVSPEHQWEVVTIDATCTVDGSITKTCKKCGVEVVEVITAYGHTYSSDFVVSKERKCVEEGEKHRFCDKCGFEDKKTIPSYGGHDEMVETISVPDCVNPEREKVTCLRTGCAYIYEREGDEGPKGHDYTGSFVEKTPATCTKAQVLARYCPRIGCGVELETTEGAQPNGHTEAHIAAVAPTCTTAGSTARKYCSVCNKTLEESQTIPALGHIESTEWVETSPATCTLPKIETRYCTRCSLPIGTRNVGTSLGHAYGGWTTTAKPTCTATGTKTQTCSRCGGTNTGTISATGHNMEKIEDFWNLGIYRVYKCKNENCGHKETKWF